jgi:DNA polymerase
MLSLKKLSFKVKKCKRCLLYKKRTQVVFGEGKEGAKILIIGEAPGKEEDKIGRPFVGKAGRFLDKLFNLAEIKREEIFITNLVKCRPENNRPPLKKEIEKCSFWLKKQIEILKPKLIITLGSLAFNFFFPNKKISKSHGKVKQIKFDSLKFKIFSTFHPASVFRQPNFKKLIEKDFKKIKSLVKKI